MRNKNLTYFLVFFLPVLIVILFVHEMAHAVTAFVFGATKISTTDPGQVDYENLNGFNEGIALFMGPFSNFLLSVILLIAIQKIKNRYVRYFIFVLGIVSAFDFISYALTGFFGLRRFIFFGSNFSIGEPEKAFNMMGIPEIFAPIIALIMILIYYPYYNIFRKIKWK